MNLFILRHGLAVEPGSARFANDAESPLFLAHEAHDIARFFRAVTMSVTARSRSSAPNASVPLVLADISDDDLGLDF